MKHFYTFKPFNIVSGAEDLYYKFFNFSKLESTWGYHKHYTMVRGCTNLNKKIRKFDKEFQIFGKVLSN